MDLKELYRKNEALLNEYEDILIGNRKVFSDQFFGAGSRKAEEMHWLCFSMLLSGI